MQIRGVRSTGRGDKAKGGGGGGINLSTFFWFLIHKLQSKRSAENEWQETWSARKIN